MKPVFSCFPYSSVKCCLHLHVTDEHTSFYRWQEQEASRAMSGESHHLSLNITPPFLNPTGRCSLVFLCVCKCYLPTPRQVHVFLDEHWSGEQDVPTGSDAVRAGTERTRRCESQHSGPHYTSQYHVLESVAHVNFKYSHVPTHVPEHKSEWINVLWLFPSLTFLLVIHLLYSTVSGLF